MNLSFEKCTHVGLVRDHNEDAYLSMPEQRLFSVCDGMGGHAAGEVASAIAVNTFRGVQMVTPGIELDPSLSSSENKVLLSSILANEYIWRAAQENTEKKGMGTTLVSLKVGSSGLFWTAVGDSRLYVFREEQLAQINIDHSLLNEMIMAGEWREEDRGSFRQKNIITRTVGTSDETSVDYGRFQVKKDDIFMLCSDGLSDYVNDEHIQALFHKYPDISKLKTELLQAALDAGAPDNVTFILVHLMESINEQNALSLRTIQSNIVIDQEPVRKILRALSVSDVEVGTRGKRGQLAYSTRRNYILNRKYYTIVVVVLATLIVMGLFSISNMEKASPVKALQVKVDRNRGIQTPQTRALELQFLSGNGEAAAGGLKIWVNGEFVGETSRFDQINVPLQLDAGPVMVRLINSDQKLIFEKVFTKESHGNKGSEFYDLDKYVL